MLSRFDFFIRELDHLFFWLGSMGCLFSIYFLYMDIHNSIMDIQKSFMDIHNSFMDIHE